MANEEINETFSSNKPNQISIPIKTIVHSAMSKHSVFYDEIDVIYLRRYFISCLNMKYINPRDLVPLVDTFTSQIKQIIHIHEDMPKNSLYIIKNNSLYVFDQLQIIDEKAYEISWFAAIFDVISAKSNSEKRTFVENLLIYIAGEKIFTCDYGSHIVMPRSDEVEIDGTKLVLRAGYHVFNKEICLLKQLFIALSVNENRIIRDAHFESLSLVISNLKENDKRTNTLLETIGAVNQLHNSKQFKKELELMEKYQRNINKHFFPAINADYYAFCALILSDSLRTELMIEKEQNTTD